MDVVNTFVNKVTQNVKKVIVGKDEIIELLLVALFVEGHILLEDVPGVGKTMLARALAVSLGGEFKRLQCTPDLLPNDVTGVSIYNQKSGSFEFMPGPIFVNILLVDEINRATPRTQSALLEAMQEAQATIDGKTVKLPRPFIVLATQNPIEYEGTFPLPEAQLDRFLMRLTMGYPTNEDEKIILNKLRRQHPIEGISPVVEGEDMLGFQEKIWDIHVDNSLQDYIIRLVSATRDHPDIALGVSPRCSLALFKTAQALALIRGRDHVLPDDIKYLVPFTMLHRLMIKPEAELRGRTPKVVLNDILEKTLLDLGSPADMD